MLVPCVSFDVAVMWCYQAPDQGHRFLFKSGGDLRVQIRGVMILLELANAEIIVCVSRLAGGLGVLTQKIGVLNS